MPGVEARSKVAVVGASGFVGSAVVHAFEAAGVDVVRLSAPRLVSRNESAHDVVDEALGFGGLCRDLAATFEQVDVVVNAAGVADATSHQEAQMFGANSLLPRVLREAAKAAEVRRYVHISSAGVQGGREPLDETPTVQPFSLYTRSKACGELSLASCPETVIFRPTSVHGPDRPVSRTLSRVAHSFLASVAGSGEQATPQVLVENVGSAVVFVALYDGQVPPIVLQPWEGLTTARLMSLLGGKEPRHVSRRLARGLVRTATVAGRRSSRLAANARRLELLWFGQAQTPGWLATTTWQRTVGLEGWKALGRS